MTQHPKKPHGPKKSSDDAVRLISAVALSLLVLFIFNHFLPSHPSAAKKAETAVSSATGDALAGAPVAERATVIARDARLPIRGKKVAGSISLKGGRVDDLTLVDYFTTIEKKAPVALLTPSGAAHAYYVEGGWVAATGTSAILPGAETVWRLAEGSPQALESGSSVTLLWDNGAGLSFERKIALDDNYMFTVTDKVINGGSAPVGLLPYHLISRQGLPEDYMGFAALHEGPVGWLGGELREIKYKTLEKEEASIPSADGGWVGISDKYWFVSLIPDAGQKFTARVFSRKTDDKAEEGDLHAYRYQVDTIGAERTLEPGAVATDVTRVYAGTKKLDLLNAYQKNVPHFNLVLDFGMWWFLTKPLFYLLIMLDGLFGHIAFAILGLTVVVRGLVFPLASKSFRSMAAFKKVAPQLQELQEKHKNDKQKLQEEIFQLYKREKVNPFSGCWPMIIQIPIFFSLYKVIMISIEMRHAPFWGWIHDLSAPDPTTVFNLFGLIDWTPPHMLMIGAWPCIMGFTMWLQQRLSPPTPDPAQRQVFALMPFFITYMLSKFAVGLVIYWAWGNILSMLQQYYIMKKAGVDVSLIHGHGERRKLKAKMKAERKSKKHDTHKGE